MENSTNTKNINFFFFLLCSFLELLKRRSQGSHWKQNPSKYEILYLWNIHKSWYEQNEIFDHFSINVTSITISVRFQAKSQQQQQKKNQEKWKPILSRIVKAPIKCKEVTLYDPTIVRYFNSHCSQFLSKISTKHTIPRFQNSLWKQKIYIKTKNF